MSLTDRTTLKSYFVTGAVPTQAQFADLIDACLIPDAEGRVGIGTDQPAHRLEVAGTVSATAFAGSGVSLTGIPASSLVGELPVAQLPPVPAAQIVGTLAASQLPAIPAAQITGALQPAQIPPLSQLGGVLTIDQLPADIRPGVVAPTVPAAARLSFPAGGFAASNNGSVQIAASGTYATPDQVFTPDPRFAFPLKLAYALTATCGGMITVGLPGNMTAITASFLFPQQMQQPDGPGLPQAQITLYNTRNGTPVLPQPGAAPPLGQWSTGVPLNGGSGPLSRFDLTANLPAVPVSPGQSFGLTVNLSFNPKGPWRIPPTGFACCPEGKPNSLGCSTFIQSSNLAARSLYLTPSGSTGLGTAAPAVKLDVAGSVRARAFHTLSDAQLKTSIEPLHGALQSIAALTPVRFQWQAPIFGDAPDTGAQIGLIAQAVEAVLPELVHTDASGIKSVDYSGLMPVLAGAVRELADQNAALLQRLQSLEERLTRLVPPSPAT